MECLKKTNLSKTKKINNVNTLWKNLNKNINIPNIISIPLHKLDIHLHKYLVLFFISYKTVLVFL